MEIFLLKMSSVQEKTNLVVGGDLLYPKQEQTGVVNLSTDEFSTSIQGKIDVSGNKLTGLALGNMVKENGNLSGPIHLNASKNQLVFVSMCETLETADLSFNKLTYLMMGDKLKELDISNNLFRWFKIPPKMEELNIEDNYDLKTLIGGEGLNALQVGNSMMTEIKIHKKLERFYSYGDYRITKQDAEKLFSDLNGLDEAGKKLRRVEYENFLRDKRITQFEKIIQIDSGASELRLFYAPHNRIKEFEGYRYQKLVDLDLTGNDLEEVHLPKSLKRAVLRFNPGLKKIFVPEGGFISHCDVYLDKIYEKKDILYHKKNNQTDEEVKKNTPNLEMIYQDRDFVEWLVCKISPVFCEKRYEGKEKELRDFYDKTPPKFKLRERERQAEEGNKPQHGDKGNQQATGAQPQGGNSQNLQQKKGGGLVPPASVNLANLPILLNKAKKAAKAARDAALITGGDADKAARDAAAKIGKDEAKLNGKQLGSFINEAVK